MTPALSLSYPDINLISQVRERVDGVGGWIQTSDLAFSSNGV
jgi:hypothetical protein